MPEVFAASLGSEIEHEQWQGMARGSCTLRTKHGKSQQGRVTTPQHLSRVSRAGAQTIARFQQEFGSPGKSTAWQG